MELATAALGSLLPKLGELLSGECKLQKGVRGEIVFLKAEMEGIKSVLNKVSKLPADQIDDNTKIWVRDLRELSYDMEDSVDKFKVRIDAPTTSTMPRNFKILIERTVGLFTRAKNLRHISDDIGDIKRRIHKVKEMKDRYRLDGTVAQPDAVIMDPRLTGIYEEVTKLVGIDGPTKKLTDLLGPLEKGAQNLKVVPVVGMGGLGKTTIARLVHERLRGQFECQAFVSVSLRPNMMQILASILRQVSKKKCTDAGEQKPEELINNIRGLLEKKRYFIVIDDVWSEEAWKFIQPALVDNNLGSKVIVTTRHVDVAKFTTCGTIYELDPLSNVDSKKLLYKRVFNVEEGIDSEFEEISMKILKKCGGIPLAIITTASLLASKSNKTKNEWYRVYYSMGSGLEKNKTLKNMRDILRLSYNDLPSHLKPCLLYLSIFPEDTDIPRDKLVRLWIAEGFINEKQGKTLYGIGQSYFNELINRSVIQMVTITGLRDCYESKGCRVHDMVLDLINSISTEENFVTRSEDPELGSQVGKIRRLIVQRREEHKYNKQPMLLETMDMSHVRTLFSWDDNPLEWKPPLSRFSVLRILFDGDFSCGKIHPKDLGSLHHLRYLSLVGEPDPETEVLGQIGNLKFLKILDIGEAFIPELPASITQLSQLEHLVMDRGVRLPNGIGYLTSLQELSYLDVRRSPNSLAELGKLTELRVLRISGLHNHYDDLVMTFLQALSNLRNIHTLQFYDCYLSLDHMLDGWRAPTLLRSIKVSEFTRLPLWFSSLAELCSLSVDLYELKEDDFCLLGALPVLRFLQLRVKELDPTTEELLVIGTFPSLAEFEFQHWDRCWLVFAQGVMPKLQRLQLELKVPKREFHKKNVQKREGGRFDDIGLENLGRLEHVTVKLNCRGARMSEVEGAETKVRDAISIHPKHPTLELLRMD